MKFRKKPGVIEAFKFDGDLMDTNWDYYVPDWAVSAYQHGVLYFDSEEPIYPPCELFIRTLEGNMMANVRPLEGNMMANVGDWIIQGVNGELYPCKPDIFEKTYEPVQEVDSEES